MCLCSGVFTWGQFCFWHCYSSWVKHRYQGERGAWYWCLEVLLQGGFRGCLCLGWEGQRVGCGTRLLAATVSEGLGTLRLWISDGLCLSWVYKVPNTIPTCFCMISVGSGSGTCVLFVRMWLSPLPGCLPSKFLHAVAGVRRGVQRDNFPWLDTAFLFAALARYLVSSNPLWKEDDFWPVLSILCFHVPCSCSGPGCNSGAVCVFSEAEVTALPRLQNTK